MQIHPKFTPPPSAEKSFFISFEGIEGAGKSTQIKKLQSIFEEEFCYNVHLFREPGGTKFGEDLRESMLNAGSEGKIHPLAQALLFASSRCQLLHQKILPLLQKKNTLILLDRYIDSTLAYQGFAEGLGVENILQLHQMHPLNYLPHRTFYLKIDLETSLKRMKVRQTNMGNNADYFEAKADEFHQKLIVGLDWCSETFPQRIEVIDANRPLQEITDDLKNRLLQLLQH